ncbi:TPA: hypothetical protein U1X82_002278 [Streptococcus suis]|nr:AP2 domain-containing protein [Streptococcus suis]HEM4277475.1 hypothetical protein [Streptococcus suis]
MPKLINLTGKRFGRLKVIKRANTIRKGVYWLCQCDCGNKKEVRGSLLTTKDETRMIRSCTCLSKEKASARQKNLLKKVTEANKPRFGVEKGTDVKLIASKKVWKNNKSGVKGVSFDKARGQWIATLNLKGNVVLCKRFKKFDDAVIARKEAEEKYFKPIIEKGIKQGII